MATLKVPHQVGDLGGYLKEQREGARLSLRQLATAAGVSNPYLSQIERGLRRPSAEVLQQIAKGLQISAEALFLRAGLLDASGGLEVEVALQSDVHLTARQKRVLLDIYATFRAENDRNAAAPDAEAPLKSGPGDVDGADDDTTAAARPGARKRPVRPAKSARAIDGARAERPAKAAGGTRRRSGGAGSGPAPDPARRPTP